MDIFHPLLRFLYSLKLNMDIDSSCLFARQFDSLLWLSPSSIYMFISNFLISSSFVCRYSSVSLGQSIFVLCDFRRSIYRNATVSSRPVDLCVCQDASRFVSVSSFGATYLSSPSLLVAIPAPCDLGHWLAILVAMLPSRLILYIRGGIRLSRVVLTICAIAAVLPASSL
jgi:hypothetical protein